MTEKTNLLKNTEHQTNPKLWIDKWKRFPEKLDFGRPTRHLVMGMPNAAKSALLEVLAAKYSDYDPKTKVIDVFGSRDNESLTWLRHHTFKHNALLVHGDTVKLSSEWDTNKISELKLSTIAKYQTILTVPTFYGQDRELWLALERIIRILWKRNHWDNVWTVLIREASSLLYSRLGVGDRQEQAKAFFIYAIKEFRHTGYALVADTLRYTGYDAEARAIAEYFWIKKQGHEGLPDPLRWLYKYYDFFHDIMRMPKWVFVLLTQDGGVANGRFQRPYWHKEEKEDILRELAIEIEYGAAINYGEKGFHAVSDFEHARIILVRLLGDPTGKMVGMATIGTERTWKIGIEDVVMQQRSSATIRQQLLAHDKDILAQGYCGLCNRVGAVHLQSRKVS